MRLVISDAHQGLVSAIRATLLGASSMAQIDAPVSDEAPLAELLMAG